MNINHLCLLLVLLLFPFVPASAQEMYISGVVIDNEGLTMPGVSVSVKGTTTGTITDIDGKYNLNASRGATLVFSFVGYTTQEVKIEKESIINITLNASTVGLNEAIVTERMKEFAAEGKLWWDYIRLGVVFKKAPYLVGRDNERNVLLWPVSQTSINKNPNITQTPGYDK